jgi:hypothetical protein
MIRKIFALALIVVFAAVQAQDADHKAGQAQAAEHPKGQGVVQPGTVTKASEDEVERLPTASIDIEGNSENGVITLTEDNFEELLKKHHPMLVFHYSKSKW